MDSDNRRSPRYSLENRVDVYFHQEGIWETEGVNISQTGILFKSRTPVGLYARAILRLHLKPGGQNYLDVEASAIRSEVQGEWFLTAMEFMDINPDEKKAITEFLNVA